MLSVQRSASEKNNALKASARKPSESNASWVARHLAPDLPHVLLIGGSSTWDFRLRVAQSHMRDDLTPSHWSHVALVGPSGERQTRITLMEIPLFPRRGLENMPKTNGVQRNPITDYDDPTLYPNLCLFTLPLEWNHLKRKVKDFEHQRTTLDAIELQLAWLAFAWGVGRLANPLYDELGFPSSALLEYACSALQYDLTPAFPSRSSCPEAIWQAACYWHELPQRAEAPDNATTAAGVAGAYVIGERIGAGPGPRRDGEARKAKRQR